MIKPFAGTLILLVLTGCEAMVQSLLDSDQNRDLCTSNRIPETPPGATDADVEREIVELCRDQEQRR